MFRAARIGTIGLLFCALTRALTASPAPETERTYTNSALRFSFQIPAGWTRKSVSASDRKLGVAAVFLEPGAVAPRTSSTSKNETDEEFLRRIHQSLATPVKTNSTFHANITVVARKTGNVSLDDYAKETRARAAKDPTYRIIGEKQRQLGGVPAVERTIHSSPLGGATLQLREVICMNNQRMYTITLTALPAAFVKRAADFDKVLSSFKWQ